MYALSNKGDSGFKVMLTDIPLMQELSTMAQLTDIHDAQSTLQYAR